MNKMTLVTGVFGLFLTVGTVTGSEIKNRLLVTDWSASGEAITYIASVTDGQIQFSVWSAEISTSKAGKTRLYFTVNTEFESCDETSLPNVFKIDDRSVAVTGYCHKYIDSELYYVSFTPTSDEGLNYTIKTFREKPAGQWVVVDGFGDALGNLKPFSADGFEDAFKLNRVL